jgi:hypothetical protein
MKPLDDVEMSVFCGNSHVIGGETTSKEPTVFQE